MPRNHDENMKPQMMFEYNNVSDTCENFVLCQIQQEQTES